MKILVTGFGPFLKNGANPSEYVAKRLEGNGVVSLVLPVSYERSGELLMDAIREEQPDLIVSFGLAASREDFSLEERAYNEMKAAAADVDGVSKDGEPIAFFGASSFETKIDLPRLQKELETKGHHAVISTDPGRYCCNEVYYLCLRSGLPSLFVHLPGLKKASPEEDALFAKDLLSILKKN